MFNRIYKKNINLLLDSGRTKAGDKNNNMNKLLERGIIKNLPKKWNDQQEAEILLLRSSGLNTFEIAERVNRSEISVNLKLKRLTKKDGSYNVKHVLDKYNTNKLFLDCIKPASVLDLFSGDSWYKGKVKRLVTCDINKKFNVDFSMPAFDLLCKYNLEKQKFDLIDLDPFGSAIEEFHLAIRLATKGIIITLGELGHKRWKRYDYVGRWYGITTYEDFTSENIFKELQRIASCHKKELTLVFKKDYNRISRVWCSIKPLKIDVWANDKEKK